MRVFGRTLLGGKDSAADNVLVRNFSLIEFYEMGADSPYIRYVYRSFSCGPDRYTVDDDTFCVYERRDGSKDRLFVKSPHRPFYLERDQEDLDLGRVVITFVPTPEDAIVGGSPAAPMGSEALVSV